MNLKRIFVIDGAAGTGKSDLLEFVEQQIVGHNTMILKKFTTREFRPEEKRTNKTLDLKFVSPQEFENLSKVDGFYNYKYPKKDGSRYGFYKSALELLLNKYDNVFLIVRSTTTIISIIKDFRYAEVIPVFVYTIESLIEERLKGEGYNDDEINFRLSRTADAMNDLYTHPNLYKRVIINNSDKTTYQRQLKDYFDKLLQSRNDVLRIDAQTHYDLPAVLQSYKSEIVSHLKNYDFNKNIFVMMKYRESNRATFDVIKMVLESKGYNCVRADMSEWSITKDDIYNPFAVLYCCKYGIALFDEPEEKYIFNANVAIELALMHMQNKHCLMLKHESLPQPPFDLASKIYKQYSRAEELVAIIRQWLTRLS